MKVYEKSNHLIIAIPMTTEGYEWAVKLRNCLIGFGVFISAVTAMDKIMAGWAQKLREDHE